MISKRLLTTSLRTLASSTGPIVTPSSASASSSPSSGAATISSFTKEDPYQLNAFQLAISSSPRSDWTKEQINEIYHTPLMELIHQAQIKHRKFHNPSEVQLCTLLSIKTGGCTENCSYCSQSQNHSETDVEASKMINIDEVMEKARIAKLNGSTRFCMGAAFREMKGRKSALNRISDMVKQINDELNMETCVTLGMIDEEQAKILKDSGLTAYNHNIDTSREHYPNVITTRTYDDRLKTIKNVQNVGIKACTGGILGLGETTQDHIGFLYTLSNMSPHPESLPINRLVPIKGTPIVDVLKNAPQERKLQFDSILRTIATARLIMPESIIRLAAGRYTMKEYEQFLCFMSGCNAIFTGEKMLTTMCNGWDEDKSMLEKWGMKPMESFKKRTPVQQEV